MSVTSERPRSPRGEGDRLRVELLDAAVDLLAETGSVDRVSLRAVAARVGVSPTAVYRHFDDHETLMQAAVLHCWQAFHAALGPIDPDADPTVDFRRCGDRYRRFALEQPGKYKVMFATHDEMGPEVKAAAVTVFDDLVQRVARILSVNGDDRDPFFVATQVHTWIHGIVDLCADDTDSPFPPTDELLDDMAVRLGLVPRPHSD